MEYRKYKADYLFTGNKLLNNEYVLIAEKDGRIFDIIPESEAGSEIQILSGILSPGFINAHCHLELSHLQKLIPEKTGLVDFVFKVVTERHFDEDEILNAIDESEEEMIKNGIVAVGDICNNDLTIKTKARKKLYYQNFIEVSGWNPSVADIRFEKGYAIFRNFSQKSLKASIIPHAPYSVSKKLWGKIATFFPQNVVTIHNQETKDEDEFF